ncbi:10728_t:CDS:2 [Racocetra persica]|uniref:10728_t:CDS:1 n=1 Tax=Racocetra persica TaxID=160502 RepID=A0ACA9LXE1_9GLOM|nr:10728_t:CDS:2 [Racocetra persica]
MQNKEDDLATEISRCNRCTKEEETVKKRNARAEESRKEEQKLIGFKTLESLKIELAKSNTRQIRMTPKYKNKIAVCEHSKAKKRIQKKKKNPSKKKKTNQQEIKERKKKAKKKENELKMKLERQCESLS